MILICQDLGVIYLDLILVLILILLIQINLGVDLDLIHLQDLILQTLMENPHQLPSLEKVAQKKSLSGNKGKKKANSEDLLYPDSSLLERQPYINKAELRKKYDISRSPGETKNIQKVPENIIELKKIKSNEKTTGELLSTSTSKLSKRPPQDTKSLVGEFKSKNSALEEESMQQKKATTYYDKTTVPQVETEEQFLERYQKFQKVKVEDIFLPGRFDINKEFARPVFIGSKKEGFERKNLIKAFRKALPLLRNNKQQLHDSFISLIYFCTAEVADKWEDSDYDKLAADIFKSAAPSESEQTKLISDMEERLKKYYKNKPEKVVRLLEQYKKTLEPQTQEQIEREGELLYQEHPELRPSVTKVQQVQKEDEEIYNKHTEDEFLGLNSLHLTPLDSDPKVNFWVGLEEEDFKKLLPEGYPYYSILYRATNIMKDVNCSHPYSLMWTKYCSEILKDLKARQKSNFLKSKSPNGVGGSILNGMKGVGKTATLAEIAMWARKNGWLVVYADGRDLTENGNILPHKKHRGVFDQPRIAVKLCKNQVDANEEILKNLPLRGSIPPSIVEMLKATSTTTLLDLLNYGIANPLNASEIFEEFRLQLNSVKEYPVLLAVDSFDRLHTESVFTDRLSLSYNASPVHAHNLVIARLFNDYDNHGLINGTFIGALTNGKPKIDWLKKNGHGHTVKINPWDFKEMTSTLEFWKKISYYRDVNSNKAVYQYHWTLSSGIGSEAFRIIKPL
eukprot:TRINITY_DN2070_c0_g1_i1.p1 TRINITY_DN2070_c0_g1~~TRINITY_DN2070_c0_g1_i1.p1  ORF type:complete len:736 (+),score=293.42 TRINITY_DN2070_c0_g1_i1:346-2553(+)